MDIISHGLWGGIGFLKNGRKSFWISFVIGMAPDLLAFGIYFIGTLAGIHPRRNFAGSRPDISTLPKYVFTLYDLSHSIIVFIAVFLIVWFLRGKPLWELLAWGIHIVVDIPTHSQDFFPTPFLWPISDYTFPGTSWGRPEIFFPNLGALAVVYALMFFFFI